MSFKPLSIQEEEVGRAVINATFKIHKELGPGLLERVYEVCLAMNCKRQICWWQVTIPIVYDGITFEEGLRLDLLVENLVICEIKAVEQVNPVGKRRF
jgi:GxxExxY protein